jgi:hypothetical protein
MIFKSLDALLPTPKGFNPMFPWQLFGQISSPQNLTHKKRSNLLRNIAKRKPNTTASRQANSWNTYNTILGPQYVTEQEIMDYAGEYDVPDLYKLSSSSNLTQQQQASSMPLENSGGPNPLQPPRIPFTAKPSFPKSIPQPPRIPFTAKPSFPKPEPQSLRTPITAKPTLEHQVMLNQLFQPPYKN